MISILICKFKNHPIIANWLAKEKIQYFSDNALLGKPISCKKNFEDRSFSFLKLIRTHTDNRYCFII